MTSADPAGRHNGKPRHAQRVERAASCDGPRLRHAFLGPAPLTPRRFSPADCSRLCCPPRLVHSVNQIGKRTVTLQVIAEATGMHLSTVSLALRNDHRVNSTT